MISMARKTLLVASAALLLFAGCDSETLDPRTHPNALDLPLITIAVAVTSAETPGQYNFQAYVTTRAICTQPSSCGESFIVVSDIKGADAFTTGAHTVLFYTDTPTQFRKGDQYLFSAGIDIDEETQTRTYTLLGYDVL